MRDLFSTLIGGDGTNIKRQNDGSYKIFCICRDSAGSFVEQLIPLCNSFSFLHKFSQSHFECRYGRVLHSFCASIRDFIRDYTQQVADLESQPSVTLPLLCSYIRPYGEILLLASSLASEVSNSKGPQIASIIYNARARNLGVDHIREFLTGLFESCSVPIVSFIQAWVYGGVVDDPFDEFFISVNHSISPENAIGASFWEDRYSIIDERIPCFIKPSTIEIILSAGKVQSILRECGAQLVKPERPLSISSIQYEAPIFLVYESSSKVLIASLTEKYHLIQCFDVLWSVFLCKKGYLPQFISRAAPLMHKSREIAPHDLESILTMILDESVLEFARPVIKKNLLSYSLQRIHAVSSTNPNPKIKPPSASKTPWDFFALKCKISWPLNIVFTKESQRKYQLLFRHLLNWIRLQQKFTSTWKLLYPIRRISGARHAIQVFITSFVNYMTNIVIDPAWSEFMDQLKETKSIKDLVCFHESLLQKLLKGCFLLNLKIFNRMTYIESICWLFAKAAKQWSISVSNDVTGTSDKVGLEKPLEVYFQKFQGSIDELIKELRSQAGQDGSSVYLDFAMVLEANCSADKRLGSH